MYLTENVGVYMNMYVTLCICGSISVCVCVIVYMCWNACVGGGLFEYVCDIVFLW